jgi:hypothetical protein
MPVQALQNYTWRGARALVLLHEQAMRDLLTTWRRAKAVSVSLPPSDNPAYASLDTVLHHALKAARNMLSWICEKLELPDPGIEEVPEAARLEGEAEKYIEHLLARWRLPLAGTDAKRLEEMYKDRNGHDTSLLARLEHAVLHPQRHRFQLEELLEGR